jgi:hypothetical protein
MLVMLSSIFSLTTSHMTTPTWNWFGRPGFNTLRSCSTIGSEEGADRREGKDVELENQRQRLYLDQNQSSVIEPKSSSNKSSTKLGLATATRRLIRPNETVRDLKRGSGTELEPIGSGMIVGFTREPRKSRS